MQLSERDPQVFMKAYLNNAVLEQYQSHKYDEFMNPPNYQIAEQHQLASKVDIPGQQKLGENSNVCPCCLQQIYKTQIDFQGDEMALSYLGLGYISYFNFIKKCILVILVLVIGQGLGQLIQNANKKDCEDSLIQEYHRQKEIQMQDSWSRKVYNNCSNDWIVLTSLANSRFYPKDIQQPHCFAFYFVIFLLILIFFFKQSKFMIENEGYTKQYKPSDYTIIVKDIPKECNQIQLQDFFENQFDIKVMDIEYVFYVDTLEELQFELDNIINQYNKAKENQDNDQLLNIQQQRREKQNQIIAETQRIKQSNELFSGTAFVSFQSEDHKKFVLISSSYRCSQVISNIFFGCIFKQAKSLQFYNSFIKVDQAPEPGDVIWDKISHNDKKRFIDRLIGFIFSKIVIALFFLSLLYLEMNQTSKLESSQEDIHSSVSKNMSAFIAALLFTLINSFIVSRLSNFLVGFESYETYTLQSISLTTTLLLIFFVNSAVIPFFLYSNNLFGSGGLIYVETYFLLINAIIPPLFTLVYPNRIIKSLKLWWINISKKVVTQKELNEYSEHQIELKYADIMKTVFVTFFFNYLLPIGSVINLVSLLCYYYAEKYVIYSRKTIKRIPSVGLSRLMTEMMGYLPILYSLGLLIFNYQIYGSTNWWNVASILISILISILPIQGCLDNCSKQAEFQPIVLFNEAKINFSTTYFLQNPVNKYSSKHQQAIQNYLKYRNYQHL